MVNLSFEIINQLFNTVWYLQYSNEQGFGAGAPRSRGIWLEPEPSLWPGSTLNICLIIHENYMELNII